MLFATEQATLITSQVWLASCPVATINKTNSSAYGRSTAQ
ncbi:MAG: hypothetical protein XXXJIFNMEKO3_01182 [Candidatus Erwinia impunctatus]|nr:hypothetical protein XXXJIFNMEKO_01182 [Culicoides impunctatus]